MTDAILFCLGRRASARTRAVHCCVVRRALLRCTPVVERWCLASSQPTMSDAECIASQSDLPPKVGDASLAATRDDAHIAEPGMDSMDHALTTTVGSHVYNGDGPSEPIALTSQPAVCLVCNGNKKEKHASAETAARIYLPPLQADALNKFVVIPGRV